jgi:hypothetical protein
MPNPEPPGVTRHVVAPADQAGGRANRLPSATG